MQFIKDGPEIPDELISAQENGDVNTSLKEDIEDEKFIIMSLEYHLRDLDYIRGVCDLRDTKPKLCLKNPKPTNEVMGELSS